MNLPKSLNLLDGKLCLKFGMGAKSASFYCKKTGHFKRDISKLFCPGCALEVEFDIKKRCFNCHRVGFRDWGEDKVWNSHANLSTRLQPKFESFKCCLCVQSNPRALPQEILDSREERLLQQGMGGDEVDSAEEDDACSKLYPHYNP